MLSLIDLLLATGEVAMPRLTANESDLRTLLEEAIIYSIEPDAEAQGNAALDRLMDWILNAVDEGPATRVVPPTTTRWSSRRWK